MKKEYLQLSFKDGKFYAYSKTQEDEYVEHKSSTGNVTYRKYYDNVSGALESVSMVKTDLGEKISLRFKTVSGDVQIAQFNIFDSKGNVDRFAESLVSFLPNLQKGGVYILSAYNFIPEKEQYAKVGVSIKDENGAKVERALSNSYYKEGKLVEGDIPAIEWVEKRGKKMPSASSLEAKTDYLYGVMEKESARLGYVASAHEPANHTAPSTPQHTEVPSAPKRAKAVAAPAVEEEDDDDLPF